MPVKVKFIAAIITGMLLAYHSGSVIAQDSQNAPSAQGQMQVPDQAPAPDPMQDQGVPQDQDQGVMQDQDQDQPPAPSGHGSAQQQDENQRPPMTELPPPPSKPSPNIQGPYGSGPQNPNYPDPNYGNPPYGNPPYNRGYGSGSYGKSGFGNSNESSSNNGVGRVSLIHGDVSTQRGDSGDWSAAVLNAPLMTGDKVSTGDNAALLVRAEGQTKIIDDPLGKSLDVIGFNEYIGWYEGHAESADTTEWRVDYQKPLIVSEFGGGAKAGLHGGENDAGQRSTRLISIAINWEC